MPRQGTAAAASQHLPGAVALLALSIAALAAVLANMERGRERRSKHHHEPRHEVVPATTSNDTLSTAVTVAAQAHADDTLHRPAAAPTVTTTGRGADCTTLRGRDNPLLPSRGGGVVFAAVGGAEGRRGGPPLLQVDHQQQSSPGHVGLPDHAATSSPLLALPTPTNRNNDRAAATLAAAGSSASKLRRTVGTTSNVGAGLGVSPSGSSRFAGRCAGTPSASAASTKARAESAPFAGGKRLEVLVHNISHKDMVLSLRRSQLAAIPGLGGGEPGTTSIDAVRDIPQSIILGAVLQYCTYLRQSDTTSRRCRCRSIFCGVDACTV